MTIQRFDVGARLSEMAVHHGVCYLAGQVAGDATQDIRGQTRQVLAAIDALLARAGSDKSRLLMCQIFLADLADFAGMNEVWEAWLPPDAAPARATCEARLASAALRVEILVTAALAVLALVLLPGRAGIVATWAFSVWGTVDLLRAFYLGNLNALVPGQLGAAYFIPTVLVPLMLITHGLVFRILLRHSGRAAMLAPQPAAAAGSLPR